MFMVKFNASHDQFRSIKECAIRYGRFQAGQKYSGQIQET